MYEMCFFMYKIAENFGLFIAIVLSISTNLFS